MIYDNLTLKDVKGELRVKDETATLNNVNSSLFDGKIALNGNVNTTKDIPIFQMNLDINGFDISDMSLNKVINSLEEYGSDEIPVKKGKVFDTLTHLIDEYKINFKQQSGNVLLKDVEMD